LLERLAGGVVAGFRLPGIAAIPRFIDLDRGDLFVSDIDRSLDFFQRIFAMPLRQPNGKWFVSIGNDYLQLGKASAGAADTRLDRISIRVSDSAQGLSPASDWDHITTEFSDPGWLDGGFVREYSGTLLIQMVKPIFLPIGIRHVLLNVTNLEASTRFYERLLGRSIPGARGRVWFPVGNSWLGLQRKPRGNFASIYRLCIEAERFDIGAALRELRPAGAHGVILSDNTSEPGPPAAADPGRTLTFSDADGLKDGFRFQIIGGH
jgi:catechol 2,3-dioxygenase-like lactoylglutathione lyase family enzyme